MSQYRCVRENYDETMGPCPYCRVGGATLAVYDTGSLALPYTEYAFVGCDNCQAQGRRFYGVNRAHEAVENWNQVSIAVALRGEAKQKPHE